MNGFTGTRGDIVTTDTTVDKIVRNLIDELDVLGSGQLLQFAVAGRMQRRTHSSGVLTAVEIAKARRSEANKPFWDALFENLAATPTREAREILRLANYHNVMNAVAQASRFAFNGPSFADALHALEPIPGDQIVALSSKVDLDSGAPVHIPMLDYRIPVGPDNEFLIRTQLATMASTGWLFESGRSYHFVGDTLLAGTDGLARFLGNALLFAPIVDGRWIAHQLIEGACALRISAGDSGQVVPRLVCRVDA